MAKTKSKSQKPNVVLDEAVVQTLTEFLENAADLDDLAELYSRFSVDGPTAVHDGHGGMSNTFENGKRVE